MILSGGVFDKIGNWFEQSLVMLQWLRLLNEHITGVCWEPLGEPGQGIDYQILESGKWVSVQCKTKSSGSWKPGELEKCLAHAREQLEANEDAIYRFYSDRPADALDRASKDAKQHDDPGIWLQGDQKNRSKFMRFMQLNPDDDDHRAQTLRWFQRIEMDWQNHDSLNQRIWEEAKNSVGESGRDALLQRLYQLCRPETLGRTWTAADLQEALSDGRFEFRPEWRAASTLAWLDERTVEFLRDIDASRRGRPEIARSEAEQVSQAIDQRGRIVLAHGGPGTGKSSVLAQAVRMMREGGVRVLALRADAALDPAVGEGEDAIDRFRSLLGERSGCFVVDQLDQAAATGSPCVQVVTRMVRAAIRCGITVVVGCRSVDAQHETSLHQILHPENHEPTRILVGDFDEDVVAEALRPRGIPLNDLGRDLLRLLRHPLSLHLFLDVVERDGAWRGQTSHFDIFDAWCTAQTNAYGPNFVPLLDAIAERMEEDGVTAVGRHRLESKFTALVQRLIDDAILVKDGDDRVRIFHQVISDTRLAVQWSNVSSPDELLQRFGSRQEQGLRHARRARLIVPLVARRGRTGVTILNGLVWKDDIRPVVRRSLLLGLSDLREVPREVADLVVQWLKDVDRRSLILHTVVRGRVAWFDVLDDWFDAAWTTWPEEQRDLLLGCCAAVAQRRGDSVAKHLARWQQESPGTLQRAETVFLHDPSEDSDELFSLRLDYLTSVATLNEHYHVVWPTVLAAHPVRAARLLAALLERIPRDDLFGTDQPDWMDDFPAPDKVPGTVLREGSAVFDTLARWWSHLDVDGSWRLGGARDLGRSRTVAQVVAFLGQCLGRAISEGHKNWDGVVAALPSPLRSIDADLLLFVGRHLDPSLAPRQAFVAAANWIRSDPRWVRVTNGNPIARVKAFLENVAPQLDASDYENLEQWLVRYPDEWTAEWERRRQALAQRDGVFLPNDRGATAFQLLPALDRSRWSATTEAKYQELERKFRGWDGTFREIDYPNLDVRSTVPDDVADGYTAEQWANCIERAPEYDERWRHAAGTNSCLDGSRDVLISQLHSLAERNPHQYLPVAKDMVHARDRVPEKVFAVLLAALGRTEPPRLAGADWCPLADDEFAQIVTNPTYLECTEGVSELAQAIAARPAYAWPDTVVARLIGIAQDPVDRFTRQNVGSGDSVLHIRLTDSSCIAWSALGRIARRHGHRQEELLSVATALVGHADLGRQAAAAVLAWSCREQDPRRATEAVLQVAREPLVAAQRDVHEILRFLAVDPSVATADAGEARRILIGLLEHREPPCAEWGGVGVMCLRDWNVLDDADLMRLLAANFVARRSAARVAVAWLANLDAPEWLRTLVVALANDGDEEVGDAILGMCWGDGNASWMESADFLTAMVQSAAARRRPAPLIRFCDRRGTLRSVSDVVLALGHQAAEQAPDPANSIRPRLDAEMTAGLLIRLCEEAGQQRDEDLAQRALDVVDQMLEAGVIGSGRAWKLVIDAAGF